MWSQTANTLYLKPLKFNQVPVSKNLCLYSQEFFSVAEWKSSDAYDGGGGGGEVTIKYVTNNI